MESDLRAAVLGCGTIGSMVARLVVASGTARQELIHLTRRNTAALEEMKRDGFVVSDDNRQAVGHADLVIICLEPRQVAGVLAEVRDVLDTANQTIISLAAGISIERIERTVGKSMEIVRAMPNTALRVREAITALATNRPGGSGIELARRLFAFGGTTIDVAEKQLDAVTALGGSGPAFFLTAIQGAITGGVAAGLQPDQARDITLQVIRGAVALVSACSNTPKDEIAEIVTPGGCTAAGLKTLDSAQFEAALSNAIVEAARRAAELGDDAATGRTSDWSHE